MVVSTSGSSFSGMNGVSVSSSGLTGVTLFSSPTAIATS